MRIRLFFLILGCLAVIAVGDRIDRRAIKNNPKVNKKSEIVEGSGLPPAKSGPGAPPDLEIHGSGGGYSSDDEDGEEIHGSGAPPSDQVEGSGRPPPAVIARPQQTTTTTTTQATPLVTGTRSTTTTHAVFNPVEKLPDPVVHVEEVKDHAVVTEIREPPPRPVEEEPSSSTVSAPTTATVPKRPTVVSEDDDDKEPTTPFSYMPRSGIIAVAICGSVIGLISAVLLVMFIVHRMRKKDEGSYALDEPKTRPYGSYSYSKAPKEFYA